MAVDDLHAALRLARRNGVQGALARIYPEALGEELDRVVHSGAEFRRRLAEAVDRMAGAGVQPVLIKYDPAADFVYSNFDLVVGREGFARAVASLDAWAARRSRHRLEPDKLILHPLTGPAAHLHQDASWFGVVAVTDEALRSRASFNAELGVLRPEPTDELRLMVAHAVFQNLAFDLAELRAIRGLLEAGADPIDARRRCTDDGWGHAFVDAYVVAREAMKALDRGEPLHLPVGLPVVRSIRAGFDHAVHLARTGRGAMALREAALRGPLVAAKVRRRLQREPVHLLGVSGPDGSGKTTLVAALRDEAERHNTEVVSLHPYGCFICRRFPLHNDIVDTETHPAGMWAVVRRAHAAVDAAELDLRVRRARAWARVRELRHADPPAVVITDRSPLDALAKHAAAGRLVNRWLRGMARRYDRIFLLDTDDQILAARDGEHTPAELQRERERFKALGTALRATPMDSTSPFSPELVGQVLRDVTTGLKHAPTE